MLLGATDYIRKGVAMEKKSGIVKKVAIAAAVVVAMAAGLLVYLNAQKFSATTMRLLKTQGDVKLFEQQKEKSIVENLRLSNGNSIHTAIESLASIALDDAKLVTLNGDSSAEFEQNGKKLNIKLTEGSLFFEVTKKLAADETFDIRTSSMTVGIRGTSGYVAIDEDGHETLYITDGKVIVTGTNPITGEVKTIEVKAGQRVQIYLYNDRKVDSIMFSLEDVTEDQLGKEITDRLIENEELMAKVINDTGWSKELIMGMELIPEDNVPASPEPPTTPDGDGGGSGSDGSGNEESSEGGSDNSDEAIVTDEAGALSSEGEDAVIEEAGEGSENTDASENGKSSDEAAAKKPTTRATVTKNNDAAASASTLQGFTPGQAPLMVFLPPEVPVDSTQQAQQAQPAASAPAPDYNAPAPSNDSGSYSEPESYSPPAPSNNDGGKAPDKIDENQGHPDENWNDGNPDENWDKDNWDQDNPDKDNWDQWSQDNPDDGNSDGGDPSGGDPNGIDNDNGKQEGNDNDSGRTDGGDGDQGNG